jgi:hypothetical protein
MNMCFPFCVLLQHCQYVHCITSNNVMINDLEGIWIDHKKPES